MIGSVDATLVVELAAAGQGHQRTGIAEITFQRWNDVLAALGRTSCRFGVLPALARCNMQCYTYSSLMMYTSPVKRLQIMIEEDLDEALGRRARRDGTSKAALIRTYVRERLGSLPPLEADPLWRMRGADKFEPADVDEVVYG